MSGPRILGGGNAEAALSRIDHVLQSIDAALGPGNAEPPPYDYHSGQYSACVDADGAAAAAPRAACRRGSGLSLASFDCRATDASGAAAPRPPSPAPAPAPAPGLGPSAVGPTDRCYDDSHAARHAPFPTFRGVEPPTGHALASSTRRASSVSPARAAELGARGAAQRRLAGRRLAAEAAAGLLRELLSEETLCRGVIAEAEAECGAVQRECLDAATALVEVPAAGWGQSVADAAAMAAEAANPLGAKLLREGYAGWEEARAARVSRWAAEHPEPPVFVQHFIRPQSPRRLGLDAGPAEAQGSSAPPSRRAPSPPPDTTRRHSAASDDTTTPARPETLPFRPAQREPVAPEARPVPAGRNPTGAAAAAATRRLLAAHSAAVVRAEEDGRAGLRARQAAEGLAMAEEWRRRLAVAALDAHRRTIAAQAAGLEAADLEAARRAALAVRAGSRRREADRLSRCRGERSQSWPAAAEADAPPAALEAAGPPIPSGSPTAPPSPLAQPGGGRGWPGDATSRETSAGRRERLGSDGTAVPSHRDSRSPSRRAPSADNHRGEPAAPLREWGRANGSGGGLRSSQLFATLSRSSISRGAPGGGGGAALASPLTSIVGIGGGGGAAPVPPHTSRGVCEQTRRSPLSLRLGSAAAPKTPVTPPFGGGGSPRATLGGRRWVTPLPISASALSPTEAPYRGVSPGFKPGLQRCRPDDADTPRRLRFEAPSATKADWRLRSSAGLIASGVALSPVAGNPWGRATSLVASVVVEAEADARRVLEQRRRTEVVELFSRMERGAPPPRSGGAWRAPTPSARFTVGGPHSARFALSRPRPVVVLHGHPAPPVAPGGLVPGRRSPPRGTPRPVWTSTTSGHPPTFDVTWPGLPMLRRTAPAVSFTTSHMALMMRSSRPVLGGDMTSNDRYKAAWDEIPMHQITSSKKEIWEWDWKCRFELGLKDVTRNTKMKTAMMKLILIMFPFMAYGFIWPPLYHALFGEVLPHMNRENGVEYSKRAYGVDVWCADGKFLTPYFHINPPMFTMTADEL